MGLACLGFGSSCTVIRLFGSDSVWCPSEQIFGNAIGLALTGLFSIATAVVMFQSEDDLVHHPPLGLFVLVKLRLFAFALTWLSYNGPLYVALLLVAVQCLARLGNKFALLSYGVTKRLPPSVLAVISLVLVLEALACAYYLQSGLFLMCYFVLALLFDDGEDTGGEDCLTPLDAFFALLLVGIFLTTKHASALLVVLELLTLPAFTEYTRQRKKRALVESMPAFSSVFQSETFSLHALPVMCATALVNTCKASSLGLWFLLAYLFTLKSKVEIVLVIVCLPIAMELGPRIANRIHVLTSSLLKTGLILFWVTCLAAVPAALFPQSHSCLMTSFIGFSGAFEALQIVQGKIACEWNGEQLGKEQLVLNSAALLVSSLACALIFTSDFALQTNLTVVNIFALFICTLGGCAYTAWFIQFGRGGAFRLIDEEGRELLSVTG